MFSTWSLTAYIPGCVYVNVGFRSVVSNPSSFWKSHAQLRAPVDRSVNVTVSGAVPLVGDAVNSALGGAGVPLAGVTTSWGRRVAVLASRELRLTPSVEFVART